MTLIQIYGIGGLVVLGLMTTLWVGSLALKNCSIADVFWGPGFVLANSIYFALGPDGSLGKWLISILVTIWGLRLGLYILWRNRGEPEDLPYRRWREEVVVAELSQGVLAAGSPDVGYLRAAADGAGRRWIGRTDHPRLRSHPGLGDRFLLRGRG